jgi:hypothetical protein
MDAVALYDQFNAHAGKSIPVLRERVPPVLETLFSEHGAFDQNFPTPDDGFTFYRVNATAPLVKEMVDAAAKKGFRVRFEFQASATGQEEQHPRWVDVKGGPTVIVRIDDKLAITRHGPK